MRFLQFLSLVIVLLLTSFGDGKDATALNLIYEDLAILSRVTNAIALQSAALQKSIKVRDVITELLQVQTGNFSELVKLDTSFLVTTLDGLYKTSHQVKTSSNEKMSIDDLYRMGNLTDLLQLISISFDNSAILNSTSIIDSVEKKTDMMLICDPVLVSTLADVSSILNGIEKSPVYENNLKLELQKSKSRIGSCMKNISNYGTVVDEVNRILAGFEEMEMIATIINDTKSTNIVIDFPKYLKHFQQIFLDTMKIMEGKKKTRASDLISETRDLLMNTIQHDVSEHSKHLFLTAGFPEKGDMNRVLNDLKSDWFREKVSQGKSTKELEKGLDPFAIFAERMKKVEESWEDFSHGFRKSNSFLAEMSNQLDPIESFQYSPNEKQFFEKMLRGCTDCLKFITGNWNLEELKKEMNVHLLFQPYREKIEVFENWASVMDELFGPAFEIFLTELMKTNLNGSSRLKDVLKNLINFEPAAEVLRQFEALYAHQQNYFELKTYAKNLSMNLGDIVSRSGMNKVSNCLRDLNLDVSELMEKVKFMRNIWVITSDNSYNRLKAIIDQFEKMKKELTETETYVKGISSRPKKDTMQSKSPILQLRDSAKLSDQLGNGMRILKHMFDALDQKDQILKATDYGNRVNEFIRTKNPVQHVKDFWVNPNPKLRNLVAELEKLDETAETFRKEDLMTIRQIFDEAAKIQGIPDVFLYINQQLNLKNTDYTEAFNNSEILKELDMDFSSHKGELNAASLSLDHVKEYFDDIFGLAPKKKETKDAHPPSASVLLVIITCIGIFLLLIVLALVSYGFTSSGKRQYKRLYYFYFGKPEDYEKRWRYSLFMDRLDGKNVLIDAVREINFVNLSNAIKKGAYINVCNKLVEILIKNGADRTFLNARNKIPEQMIPENYQETEKEKIERYRKIEKIYNKYRSKKFKQRFPEEFPVSSFHIFIEEHTEDVLTNAFTTKFQSITSDEFMPTTTHCIVKTIDDEIFETDDITLLSWIFNGAIIVKESWMADCLKNNKLIAKDYDYLVEKVKYRGVVYDTVTQWANAMAKGKIPFLYGVHVVFVMKECPNLVALATIITNQGGTMLETFPEKENYNKRAHPYLHNNLGPIFIIHDGTNDLSSYKNDADKLFTLFTEQEFLMFMLKREIDTNTNPNPISILVDGED